MNELIWSFVAGLENLADGRVFRLSYTRERLRKIGYPEDLGNIPEGLLIEGAAQAGGLSLFLDHPGFRYLPVLAKINRARFFAPYPVDRLLKVAATASHLSDSGAQLECRMFDPLTGAAVVNCEILLGFVPFEDLPDSGKEVRNRLEGFISGLEEVIDI
jgi:hypothetical protein